MTLPAENILPASTAAPGLQAQQKQVRVFPLALSHCRGPLAWLCRFSCFARADIGAISQLEKHMRADTLNEKISNRPPPEKLIKDGVLHEDPRSPEEKYEEAIEEEYAKREGGA